MFGVTTDTMNDVNAAISLAPAMGLVSKLGFGIVFKPVIFFIGYLMFVVIQKFWDLCMSKTWLSIPIKKDRCRTFF